MRLLISFSIVQCILVLLVWVKISSLESLIVAETAVTGHIGKSETEPYTLNTDKDTTTIAVNEETIRRIIQQELNSAGYAKPESAENNQQNKAADRVVPDETMHQLSIDKANQKLQYYLSNGRASNSDIEAFYSTLSNLEIDEQKLMMNQFARAVNSGHIKITP